MKRFAVLLMVVLFGCGCAAEGLDYASMTTDELIEMRNAITEEMNARYSGDILTEGKYVEGVDIKAGTYVLTALKIYEGEKYVFVATIDANGEPIENGYVKSVGESFTVRVDEGCTLSIFKGECGITRLSNSFMP
ncbi:MAG: hypothetical protein E7317_10265 [Clostridiales bacterium]|nr:hypothetical protein [Clostridiales bacterium]